MIYDNFFFFFVFIKDFLIAISVTAQGDAKKKLVLAFKM